MGSSSQPSGPRLTVARCLRLLLQWSSCSACRAPEQRRDFRLVVRSSVIDGFVALSGAAGAQTVVQAPVCAVRQLCKALGACDQVGEEQLLFGTELVWTAVRLRHAAVEIKR